MFLQKPTLRQRSGCKWFIWNGTQEAWRKNEVRPGRRRANKRGDFSGQLGLIPTRHPLRNCVEHTSELPPAMLEVGLVDHMEVLFVIFLGLCKVAGFLSTVAAWRLCLADQLLKQLIGWGSSGRALKSPATSVLRPHFPGAFHQWPGVLGIRQTYSWDMRDSFLGDFGLRTSWPLLWTFLRLQWRVGCIHPTLLSSASLRVKQFSQRSLAPSLFPFT